MGRGNAPAFTLRQIVVRLRGMKRVSCLTRIKPSAGKARVSWSSACFAMVHRNGMEHGATMNNATGVKKGNSRFPRIPLDCIKMVRCGGVGSLRTAA